MRTAVVAGSRLWTTPGPAGPPGEDALMSIEVPVLEVLGLADRLRAAAEHGTAASARLGPPGEVGALTAGLADFVECFALAARAVGSETDLLGSEVAATARSWLALDSALLARRGQVLTR